MTSSKRRVFWPPDASIVLPCIGSQIHATCAPLAVTFSTTAGRPSRILPAPKRVMNESRPGTLSGLSFSISSSACLGRRGRAELHADRVADLRGELDVRAVELAGALADPEEVAGHVVRQLRARVDAGQRELVVEQQRLVAA